MRQLFIFTAGNQAARAHLDDSIKKPISSALINKHLEANQADLLKSFLENPDEFYAWGAVPGERNIPMWNAMHDGDVVLTVFDNHYRYISTVISKIQAPELAKEIWGTDPDGNTWEYMYFLTKPKPIEVPISQAPAIDYLNNGYRGFTKISEEKTSNIHKRWGSLKNFVEQAFSTRLPQDIVEMQVEKAEKEAEKHPFSPDNLVDARQRVFAEIVRRRGQPKFRKSLLDAYGNCCAVTGCNVEAVLEAAHIIPYLDGDTNHVSNGLLLRADIHTLYDLGELRIDPNGVIHVSERLKDSIYGPYEGKTIRLPSDKNKQPHKEALEMKFSQSL